MERILLIRRGERWPDLDRWRGSRVTDLRWLGDGTGLSFRLIPELPGLEGCQVELPGNWTYTSCLGSVSSANVSAEASPEDVLWGLEGAFLETVLADSRGMEWVLGSLRLRVEAND